MEQLLLVLRGTPAAVDEELDPVVRGIGRGLAQGTERAGSRLATPGISSSKTVVPSGTAPSASPSARTVLAARDVRWVQRAVGDEDAVEDEDASNW